MTTHPFKRYAEILHNLNTIMLDRTSFLAPPRAEWTEVEITHLKYLYGKGATTEQLERAFPHRTYAAIKNKAAKMGIYKGERR